MKFETKYELKQKVYFIKTDMTLGSGNIIGVRFVESERIQYVLEYKLKIKIDKNEEGKTYTYINRSETLWEDDVYSSKSETQTLIDQRIKERRVEEIGYLGQELEFGKKRIKEIKAEIQSLKKMK